MLRLAGDPHLVEQARGGSVAAFEVLYDRHHRGVLAFCRHMLGSVDEAEDAVQHTFIAAHGDLVGTRKAIQLRPWLYAIARNRCLTMLRARRERPSDTIAERPSEPLAVEVQRREDLRDLVRDVGRLPDEQRGALVLAELGDVPHDEIAQVLGCPPQKVKSLVFQARSSLTADREARDASCQDVRRLLASLGGGSLRRNVLRRHLRQCGGCRDFRSRLRSLGIVLPVTPAADLKEAVMASALGGSAPVAALGAGAVCAGGTGVLAAKALVAVAVAGGGTAAAVAPQRGPGAGAEPAGAPAPAVEPRAAAGAASSRPAPAPRAAPRTRPVMAPVTSPVQRRPRPRVRTAPAGPVSTPAPPAGTQLQAPSRQPEPAAAPVAGEPPPAEPEVAEPVPEPAPAEPEPVAAEPPPAELPANGETPDPVAEVEQESPVAEEPAPEPTPEPAPEEPAPEDPS